MFSVYDDIKYTQHIALTQFCASFPYVMSKEKVWMVCILMNDSFEKERPKFFFHFSVEVYFSVLAEFIKTSVCTVNTVNI